MARMVAIPAFLITLAAASAAAIALPSGGGASEVAKGRVLVDVKAKGKLRNFGLTELFFEASEPSFTEFPFSKFKKRFPEGKYTWKGQTGARGAASWTCTSRPR